MQKIILAGGEKTELNVKLYETFLVQLNGNYIGGYQWDWEISLYEYFKEVSVVDYPPVPLYNSEGEMNIGGGMVTLLKLKAMKTGYIPLVFVKKRPWNSEIGKQSIVMVSIE